MPLPGIRTIVLGTPEQASQQRDRWGQRVTSGGVETNYPMALRYVLATVPALAAYNDGQGHAATISYPNNGASLPVSAGPSGDVVLTITFWRPQRRPMPGEKGYGKRAPGQTSAASKYKPKTENLGFECPLSTISQTDPPDPSLTFLPTSPVSGPEHAGFLDEAPDRLAEPKNTLSSRWNVTHCAAAAGFPFNPGDDQDFGLIAATPSGDGRTTQVFGLHLVPSGKD